VFEENNKGKITLENVFELAGNKVEQEEEDKDDEEQE
jgi:hypothetical protein